MLEALLVLLQHLGPVAWNVASKRIEQVLPSGFRFGRGWVGEYEPLPTAVLMLETGAPREPPSATRSLSAADLRKEDEMFKAPFAAKDDAALKRAKLEGRLPFAGSIVHSSMQQNSAFRNVVEPKNDVSRQSELDPIHLASQNRNDLAAGEKQCPYGLETAPSTSMEAVLRSRNLLQTESFKHPGTHTNGVFAGAMPNGKVMNNDLENSSKISLSSDSIARPKAGTYFPNRQQPVFGEPVGVMTMLTQKAQKQQKPSNRFTADMASVPPSAPQFRRDDPHNASTTAVAPTWISMGAGGGYRPKAEMPTNRSQIYADSLYNPTREFCVLLLLLYAYVNSDGILWRENRVLSCTV